MGHRDLWESVLFSKRMLPEFLSFQWVSSHVGLEGNEGADLLAERGRLQHPFNYLYVLKRPCVKEGKQLWEALGLEEMGSDLEGLDSQSEVGSTGSSSTEYEVRSVGVGEDTVGIGSAGSSPQYAVSDVESSGGERTGVLEKRLRAG